MLPLYGAYPAPARQYHISSILCAQYSIKNSKFGLQNSVEKQLSEFIIIT